MTPSEETVWVVMEIRDWYPKLCVICSTREKAERWLASELTTLQPLGITRGDYTVEQWTVDPRPPAHAAWPATVS